MLYLYFNQSVRTLWLYTDPRHMINITLATVHWKDIDNVAADKDRGQICAHVIGKGIVAEFPTGHTVLTCQQPEK